MVRVGNAFLVATHFQQISVHFCVISWCSCSKKTKKHEYAHLPYDSKLFCHSFCCCRSKIKGDIQNEKRSKIKNVVVTMGIERF